MRLREHVYVDIVLKKEHVQKIMKGHTAHCMRKGVRYAVTLQQENPIARKIEALKAQIAILEKAANPTRNVSPATLEKWRANAAKARAAKKAKAGQHA